MIRKEIITFLVVGTLTVCVDFLSYHALLLLDVWYSLAKGLGFIFGTVFAYFANKYWTFGHVEMAVNSIIRFSILYTITLATNIIVNQSTLSVLAGYEWRVNVAFVVATGVSAILNFVGMKFFVFKA